MTKHKQLKSSITNITHVGKHNFKRILFRRHFVKDDDWDLNRLLYIKLKSDLFTHLKYDYYNVTYYTLKDSLQTEDYNDEA